VSIDLSLIKEVNFSRHQLRSIDRKAFAGFINLSKINLRKNKLTVINTVDLFSGLLNLQEINLYGNQLEFLYSEVFKGLANLKKLDLSDNKLQVLDCNIFRG
jgi:Leucine-rich repeat (LRR) protein